MKISKSPLFNLRVSSAFASILFFFVVGVWAQGSTATAITPQKSPDPAEIDRAIKEFTAAEAEYRTAFNRYGHIREVIVQTFSGTRVTGEYHRITRTVKGKDGKSEETVVAFPPPTLTEIVVTKDDLEALGGKFQFALASPDSDKYKFSYVGTEKIQDILLYVFEVKPISLSKDERLFEGKVWVDSRQHRILKTKGRARDKSSQVFPEIETYRTVVDRRYLFPSVAASDDEIVFKSGTRVHVRMNVKFSEYNELK